LQEQDGAVPRVDVPAHVTQFEKEVVHVAQALLHAMQIGEPVAGSK